MSLVRSPRTAASRSLRRLHRGYIAVINHVVAPNRTDLAMTSTLSGTPHASVDSLPTQTLSRAAAEAAALFDPDVREILVTLERARARTDGPAN